MCKCAFANYSLSPKLGSQKGESTLYNPNPESYWGPPRMFPPGEPRIPVKLRTPDQPLDDCPVSCADLKLEYNPNKEGPGTIFECDTPIIFGESNTAAWPDSRLMEPVKIATTNRCHLFCDRVSNNSYQIASLIDIPDADFHH